MRLDAELRDAVGQAIARSEEISYSLLYNCTVSSIIMSDYGQWIIVALFEGIVAEHGVQMMHVRITGGLLFIVSCV